MHDVSRGQESERKKGYFRFYSFYTKKKPLLLIGEHHANGKIYRHALKRLKKERQRDFSRRTKRQWTNKHKTVKRKIISDKQQITRVLESQSKIRYLFKWRHLEVDEEKRANAAINQILLSCLEAGVLPNDVYRWFKVFILTGSYREKKQTKTGRTAAQLGPRYRRVKIRQSRQ